MNYLQKRPTVFISSTCYDLKQVRADLKDFFEDNYGFDTMLSEFDSFPIDPCVGTFENCLNNVDNLADLFILIIGARYGYITDQGKSITNLEYLHAKAKGIPIYVFVSKQLYDNWFLWKSNKNGDFSSVVDNPKIFEFVSEIYDESRQWVFTYDTVRDIKITMKNQLNLIFMNGLEYVKLTKDPQNAILEKGIPTGAARALIEKPYAWEYKFFAHILKDEFDKLKRRRWDFEYGIFYEHISSFETANLLDFISEKLYEIIDLISILSLLVNTVAQDALGAPGSPSDLEMIVYVSKRLASLYERLVGWALFFKSLHVDEIFSKLIQLLYELPRSTLDSIEDFVNRFYIEVTNIPDVDDKTAGKINVICKLDTANADEIQAEINRLSALAKN